VELTYLSKAGLQLPTKLLTLIFGGRLWLIAACLFALVLFFAAASLAVLAGNPRRPAFQSVASVFSVVMFAVLIARFVILMIRLLRAQEPHPLFAWSRAIREKIFGVFAIFLGSAAICLFLVSISWTKSLLPQLVPFWADHVLSSVDKALFHGHPQLLAGSVTAFVYALWQAAHLGMVLWALHWHDGSQKNQVLIAFMVTWTLGMVAAYGLSSAGPIFTGTISGVDPLTKLQAQFLWQNYKAGTAAIGGGISAFPSMHVAIAVWIALALKEHGWGLVGVPFAILTSMGAITLGWHYSMDILGGLAVAMAAWGATRLLIATLQSFSSRNTLAATRLRRI
jgi:hypothetical protein